jgi:GTP1/Obg family GTP-binding protein
MLEKQRIHLEELIDYYVERCLEAEKHFGTDKAGMAMSARTKARDDLKEYLNFIQDYVGTLCATTPGINPMLYITREEKDE